MMTTTELPLTLVNGTPEEIRDWAISILGRTIHNYDLHQSLPPEAFLVFERMVNSRFLEPPSVAMAKDLEDLNARLRHLESSTTILSQLKQKSRNDHNRGALQT